MTTARRYSLAQHTAARWSPPEMIYNAHMTGYDAVGIRAIRQGIANEHICDLSGNDGWFELTKQAIADTGVPIHDVDIATIRDDTDILAYRKIFERVAALGVQNVVSSVWTPHADVYTEKFALLCDLAAQYSMNVHLEFVTWASIKTLQEALALLHAVNRPNARILVDALHAYRSRVSVDELEQCPRELLELFHICDAPFEIPDKEEDLIFNARCERLYVGEGAIDVAAMAHCMREDAVFAVELPNDSHAAEVGTLEHVRRCLTTAKAYFERNKIRWDT